MNEDLDLRIGFADARHFVRRDLLVNVTEAFPGNDVLLGNLLGYVASKVAVGYEENVPVRERAYDLRGIPRGDDDIGERLHRCGRVDIAHDRQILKLQLQLVDPPVQVFSGR